MEGNHHESGFSEASKTVAQKIMGWMIQHVNMQHNMGYKTL